MSQVYSLDDILGARFGEVSNKIVATFKKTVQINQYEPETIELTSEVNVNGATSGPEKMLIAGLLEAQVEQAGLWNMLCKKHISQEYYTERKNALEISINSIIKKYKALTGEEEVPFIDIK